MSWERRVGFEECEGLGDWKEKGWLVWVRRVEFLGKKGGVV